jgi:23S rRNA (pseudouridine1915-N3)-methyltransferase
MLKITVACVGTLKEKYWQEGLAEYVKRLAPFCKLAITAIPEEKMPADPAPAEKERVLAKETERLLAVIPPHAYVIVLDVVGKQLSSPELAAKLADLTVQGVSHVVFVIGGAFGFTDALRQRAQLRLSFSRLTFTHQMMRVLLLEQIYRAFKINRGEKYHW